MFDNDTYAKLYKFFSDLTKSDMSLDQALRIARQASPKAGNLLAKHLYTDSMVPKVGNLFAYKDFLSRNENTGIHLSLDANSFGAINKEFGFEAGNEAIKKLFGLASESSRKFGLKAFRVGGDEGRFHALTPERATAFVKDLREKLDSHPKLFGNHKLSVSIGIGYSPTHAEQALIKAKDHLGPMVGGIRKKINQPGSENTVDHSLLHESPPPNWRPAIVSEKEKPENLLSEHGLKVGNPLKKL